MDSGAADDLLRLVDTRLRSVFAGRPVVFAGRVAAALVPAVDQLRALGAPRFLIVHAGAGTGERPEGADVESMPLGVVHEDDFVAELRAEERAITRPGTAVLDALERFDPDRRAVVLSAPFLDVRECAGRPVFGARRPEWVALEDKMLADDLFDATSVPRPKGAVGRADPDAIARAVETIDDGAGTVWSGDARGGFNGGGALVRWVRDDADRADASDYLLPRCDRVRVAAYVEGVPCSIHGFVVDDGVAAFRPVELVTLRAAAAPRLRYCGCATYFDPPPDEVAAMRAAVRRVGEYLRATVGFRGAFTIDGIVSDRGWVATECNPRFGAGLGYAAVACPDLRLEILHAAVAEGVVDVPSSGIEELVVDAAARTRWGGTWTSVTRVLSENTKTALVGGVDGFRRAAAGEVPDAVLSAGPGRTGGHVRVDFDPARTPSGPSIAPRAVAGLAFADAELDLGIGPLAPARPMTRRATDR